MNNIPEITKNLLIINVLFFVSLLVIGAPMEKYLALYPLEHENFRFYQFITHMFMHGGEMHLFMNMFTLFMFGRSIERTMGPQRFLFYYLSTGFGAALLHFGIMEYTIHNTPGLLEAILQGAPLRMVGASGAIFGLLAAYAIFYPNQRIMLLIPPIPIKAKYFVSLLALYELYSGLRYSNSGVAHYAHLGGALFGFLIIQFWRKQNKRF